MDEGVSYQITFSEIEEFTRSFTKQISKGNFGPVYYGIMKDGKEVAIKVMADSSSHVTRQIVTEVTVYAFFVYLYIQYSGTQMCISHILYYKLET